MSAEPVRAISETEAATACFQTRVGPTLPTAGSGQGAYLATMERVVLPAIERYRPELIAIGSGFDAAYLDPLGCMMLHSDTYREMTRMVLEAADRHCGGRLVLTHEGGYSAGYVPFCGLAVMEQLLGMEKRHEDPFLPLLSRYPGQQLQAHQAAVIDRAAELVARIR